MADEEEFPDFELIPEDDDDKSVDEELADLVDPDDLAEVETDDADEGFELPIGRSPFLDWSTGFAIGGGNPQWVTGNDAVVQVAQVAIRHRRDSSPIFDDEFGMDDPDALIGYPYDVERRALYQADVIETLLACHDRITAVGNFEYEHDADSEILYVSLEIEIDGEIETQLERVPIA